MEQPSVDNLIRQRKRCLAVEKSFAAHGYTPYCAKVLAGVFVTLSESGDEPRKAGVLGLIKRIMDGKNK